MRTKRAENEAESEDRGHRAHETQLLAYHAEDEVRVLLRQKVETLLRAHREPLPS